MISERIECRSKQTAVCFQSSSGDHHFPKIKMSGSGSSVADWIDFNQKNKPQSNALSGGIITMLISGMQIAWIFNSDLQTFPWARGETLLLQIMTYASFYLAGILGIYAATIVIERLTKKNIYVSSFRSTTFYIICNLI